MTLSLRNKGCKSSICEIYTLFIPYNWLKGGGANLYL